MSEKPSGYWTVKLEAYAFETEEAASEFQHALIDAFCEMPLAEHMGSSTRVVFEPDDATDGALDFEGDA